MRAAAIAVDAAGNAYVTGVTDSDQTTFPVKVGPDLTFNLGSLDAFVAKVKADGTALVYLGYIGGADLMRVAHRRGHCRQRLCHRGDRFRPGHFPREAAGRT